MRPCSIHPLCQHRTAYCQCEECSGANTQCEHVIGLEMDRPNSEQGKQPDNRNQVRENDLHCSETLRSSISSTPKPRPRLAVELPGGHNPFSEYGTRLSTSPGATTYSGFHFPAVGSYEHACYLRDFNEHIQLANQREAIRRNSENTTGQLPAVANMDPETTRRGTTNSIRDKGRNSPEKSADTSGTEVGRGETSRQPNHPVEVQGERNVRTPSDRERPSGTSGQGTSTGKQTSTRGRKRSRETSHPRQSIRQPSESSEEETENTNTSASESEASNSRSRSPPRQRRRRRDDSSDRPDRTGGTWYTFILHKENQAADWKQSASHHKQAPNFISFDHGDHLHIVYPGTKSGNNITRSRTRIIKYLGATPEGSTEAIATTVKVKWIRNFLLYCIRYGIETTALYGSTIRSTLSEVNNLFKELFSAEDPNNIIQNMCPGYEERGKERRHRNRGKKMENLVDIIRSNIAKYQVETAQQWENKVPKSIKLRLLKEYGLSYETYVQKCVRYNRADKVNDINEKTLTEFMIEHVKGIVDDEKESFDFIHNSDNLEIIRWIQIYFVKNEIDAHEVFAWNECIKTKRYQKINGLIYEGPTNAGKSLINDNIVRFNLKPEVIPKQNDNSSFHLDQLPAASSVIFQEPFITPVNVGTWKELLEGAEIKVDQKNKDKEPIPRVPIFITTASDICKNVDNYESLQIRQRIVRFKLKCTIHHKDDEFTAEAERSLGVIRRTPAFMYPKHWALVWLMNWEHIWEHIKLLDTKNTKTNTCIEITEDVYMEADKYCKLAHKLFDKCIKMHQMLRK